MSRKIKDLFGTNWENELQDGDVRTRREDGDELQVVLLAGLQRLAREAGIIRQAVTIQTPAPTMVQAIFESTFHVPDEGEVTFVGTADCNKSNTNGKFANYPTAVAESRAEARSLRKALGIRMLSSEEVGFREGAGALEATPGGRADSQLVAAIEKLCETRSVEPVTVIEAVLDEQRAAAVFELTDLMVDEAQLAMGWLNDQSLAKTKATTKTKRDARKAELEAKGK